MSSENLSQATPHEDALPAAGTGQKRYQPFGQVELTMSVELGRRMMSVREILQLKADDLLVLPRTTGDNIDLFAGNVLIGNAEILYVDDYFAARLADLFDKPGLGSAAESQIVVPAGNQEPQIP